MSRFVVTFKLDNEDSKKNLGHTIKHVLGAVIDRITNKNYQSGNIRDLEGSTIGYYELAPTTIFEDHEKYEDILSGIKDAMDGASGGDLEDFMDAYNEVNQLISRYK